MTAVPERATDRGGVIAVAGHLCLDVTPSMEASSVLEPGALVEVGPAAFAAGGAVANVGLALAALGCPVRLSARIGRDPFGDLLADVLERASAGLDVDLPPSAAATSYSVVVNPAGQDRIFLHHAGCNHEYRAEDLDDEALRRATVVHLGYPPLMEGLYRDGGAALAEAFARLRMAGATVSMDMAMPDPNGPSGQVDWDAFLTTVLPEVDLFTPSWDETLRMLDPHAAPAPPAADSVADVADRLLERGPALVALKLGEAGLYLRTAGPERIARAGRARLPAAWARRELWSPNFSAEAINTTGAGDVTVAGLLSAIVDGASPEGAATFASAMGACAVEASDGAHRNPDVPTVRARMRTGRRAVLPVHEAWPRHESGVRVGPRDRTD